MDRIRPGSFRRFSAAGLALIATVCLVPAAFAQQTPAPGSPPQAFPPGRIAPTPPAPEKPDTPPAEQPRQGARLDQLFERLRGAADENAAKPITAEIERQFERSGSATTDLLFTRAKEAMTARDFDLAIDLFDYITLLRPGWAEPYHRRAIIHFIRQDQDAAFRDVRETLAREPRHYHALAGLGGILSGFGDKKGAFKAYTKVLEINPHFPALRESLEKLRSDVEGQPI
jgi:tetratricopeptide (TPR) repeat protein